MAYVDAAVVAKVRLPQGYQFSLGEVPLRKEGMGATEIAWAVGCKRGNVYKALRAAGLN